MPDSPQQWAEDVLAGRRRALARLMTGLENGSPDARAALSVLYPHTGRAYLVGVTGAPGTGKSTLVNALARVLRAQKRTIGIIAVDPTSSFSGGAVLGDRIRMADLTGDPGVFIRSMANRGSLGGLSATTGDVARALDAAGFDVVLIETVGAGQSEVDIARTASTTIVVDAPGLGDEVQAIKAGILEIADILVVNKADRPGAQNTVRALRAMLETGHRFRALGHHGMSLTPREEPAEPALDLWRVPILETIAHQGEGVDAVAEAIERHHAHLRETGMLEERERLRVETELTDRLREGLLQRLLAQSTPGDVEDAVARILARELDPGAAAAQLLNGKLP